MQRIIFIDIDGPIINTPCYAIDPHCSIKRSVMNTQAIGYVIMLAKQAKAKIVTNSAHNYESTEMHLDEGGNLQQDLVRWGMPHELFHKNWRTRYPWPERDPSLIGLGGVTLHPRMEAINQWQKENGEADWVCFDDDPFTTNGRLVHVTFDDGIDAEAFARACDVMKCHGSLIIT